VRPELMPNIYEECKVEEQLFSGLQIPSINDIEMELRP